MSLEFEFVVKDPRWNIDQLSEVGARSAFVLSDHLIFPDMASAVVMACSDLTIAELNKNFRGKPQPTNVLSWPSAELATRIAGRAPLLPVEAELGDIAMAFESCISEAYTANLSIMDHVTHLLIHATLHLIGYDHVESNDAELMEKIEVDLLAKLGISNPYKVHN